MRLIEAATRRLSLPRQIDCPQCGAILEYDREDIVKVGCLADDWYNYRFRCEVRCPWCKTAIPVPTPTEDER